jgi:predicted ribosome quality control (RQC) complex YloA/Tae2 family protein
LLNNFFTLKSQADFLNSILPGSEIAGISTHENNKIVLFFSNYSGKQYFLFISLERNFETLFLEDNFSNPKKNVYYFFESIYGKKIRSVKIKEYDRVIQFCMDDNKSLIFSAIPMKGNLFLVTDDVINDCFRDKNVYISRSISGLLGPGNSPDLNKPIESRDDLSKKLPFLGKFYSDDLFYALKQKDKTCLNLSEPEITNYINGLLTGRKYLVYVNADKIVCSLKELHSFSDAECFSYNDSNAMVRNCYYKSLSLSRKSDIKKNLLSGIDGKIIKLKRKIFNLKNNLDNSDDSENLKHFGDLILNNIHFIKKGSKVAEIEDFKSGNMVKIKLKENLSPAENAEYYYSKYKGFKNSVDILSSKIIKYEKDLEKLVLNREKILREDNQKTLSKMEKKTENIGNSETLPFRIFKLSDKFEVWVGKSSASNDLLTMKYARQYDLWFHVRGSSGSHTVLRLQDKNELPGKETIKTAASIAAYYSKARNGKNVPVAFCERKYVKKRKGMNQGAVVMEKEKVVFTDPKLPE